MRNKETPPPQDLGPGPQPESYLRGFYLLLPPAVIAAYLGEMFVTGRGPRGQAEQLCNWFFGFRPLLVIYILVTLFFLGKRQCPKWFKDVEVLMALIILVPLLFSSGLVLVLFMWGLGPPRGAP